jgi:hypothetical protein
MPLKGGTPEEMLFCREPAGPGGLAYEARNGVLHSKYQE